MSLPSTRLKAYAFLLINVICWGASLVIVKPALDYTTPFRYLFYRFALAVVLSLPFLIHYLPRIKNLAKQLRTIASLEIIGTTVSLGILYIGLQKTSALEASVLVTTSPIFAAIIGTVFFKEKEERHEAIGLLLAFFGTIVITLIPLLNRYGLPAHFSILGNVLILLQNAISVVYFFFAKRAYKQLPKLFVTTISFYVGAISFFVLSLMQVGWSLSRLVTAASTDFQQPSVLIAAGYMALFGSIIGLTAYIEGQNGIEVSEASLFGYLQPLIYIPLAYYLLNEKVSVLELIALGFILTGVWIAERRTRSRRRQKVVSSVVSLKLKPRRRAIAT